MYNLDIVPQTLKNVCPLAGLKTKRTSTFVGLIYVRGVRVARLLFLLLLHVFRTPLAHSALFAPWKVAAGVKRPYMGTHVYAWHTDRFQFMDENKNTTNL